MNEETLPAKSETKEIQDKITAAMPDLSGDIYSNPKAFEHSIRIGKMISESQFIPDLYKKNVSDCTLAVIMAQQLKVHPLVFMHEVSAVHGRPCFNGKFLKALIDASGYLDGELDWEQEGEGDKRRWRAVGKRRSDGKVLQGNWVSVQLAKDEGWYAKNPKWRNMTEQMLCYRSTSFFANQWCPHVKLGMMSQEEMMDLGGGVEVSRPSPSANLTKKLRGE